MQCAESSYFPFFSCGGCPPGYDGDGRNCTEVGEGARKLDSAIERLQNAVTPEGVAGLKSRPNWILIAICVVLSTDAIKLNV